MLRILALFVALDSAGCQVILGIGDTHEGTGPGVDAAIPDAAGFDGAEDAAVADVASADTGSGDAPVMVDGPISAIDAPTTGFTISINPAVIHVVRGGAPVGATVTVDRAPGFTGDVMVTVGGLPAGVVAGGITITNPASSGPITFSASASAPLGLATVSLAGDSGSHANDVFQILVTDPPGTLDVTFNSSGLVTSQPLGAASYLSAAALVRPDGRVVVFGSVRTGIGGDAVDSTGVSQLGVDGQPDSQFGTGGVTIINDFGATHMALGPNGEVVLAGFNGADVRSTLVRLDANGHVDTAFGVAGGSAPDAGLVPGEVVDSRAYEPSGVVVQSTGAIVYVQHAPGLEASMSLVCRLTSVGFFDSTFASNGCWESTTLTPFVEGLAVSADDDLFLGGTSGSSASHVLYTGHLDPDGHTAHEVAFPSTTTGYGIAGAALDGGDTLIVGGAGMFGVVARAGDSGIDTSWKGFGYVLSDPGGFKNSSFTAAVEQPDSSVVVVGSTTTAVQTGGCAVRYDNFGNADNGFGAGGFVFLPGVPSIAGVAVAPEGRLVLVGIEASGSVDIVRIWQ